MIHGSIAFYIANFQKGSLKSTNHMVCYLNIQMNKNIINEYIKYNECPWMRFYYIILNYFTIEKIFLNNIV